MFHHLLVRTILKPQIDNINTLDSTVGAMIAGTIRRLNRVAVTEAISELK